MTWLGHVAWAFVWLVLIAGTIIWFVLLARRDRRRAAAYRLAEERLARRLALGQIDEAEYSIGLASLRADHGSRTENPSNMEG